MTYGHWRIGISCVELFQIIKRAEKLMLTTWLSDVALSVFTDGEYVHVKGLLNDFDSLKLFHKIALLKDPEIDKFLFLNIHPNLNSIIFTIFRNYIFLPFCWTKIILLILYSRQFLIKIISYMVCNLRTYNRVSVSQHLHYE